MVNVFAEAVNVNGMVWTISLPLQQQVNQNQQCTVREEGDKLLYL
jgi:hypothetical protein